ncbi:vesicle-trafficking protein SEC22b-B-like [Symsagittifera roscoffensis]|uniref:vesicle-trafficking protein SEC22b-B-like n=1 Tax=Symsagittifera roscoffensis TaxID=84072 RepID=UPI00307B1E4A
MILLTFIGRVTDGLPLSASIQEDEKTGRELVEYQNQAKQLLKRLNIRSPQQCTLESGNYLFHYLISNEICFLCLCERTFSKRLAYEFLEDISTQFLTQYAQKYGSVGRPYAFIEFDTYIQRAKKSFTDGATRGKRNLVNVSSELQGIQRIMVQNIDDVLQRGEKLSDLDDKASSLSMMSAKYSKSAKSLNSWTHYVKFGLGFFVLFAGALYLRFWWF